MLNALMTNDEVLLAAGVTQEEIATLKTVSSASEVGLLDPIFKKVYAYTYEQRIEWANLDNPLRDLEQSYAAFNGGELNGMFQETLIPAPPKGNNGLYGGKKYVAGQPQNPWDNLYFGEDPYVMPFILNAHINRSCDAELNTFLMYYKKYSMIDFVRSVAALMPEADKASRYAIENNVLNCEKYQYKTYATADVWEDAGELSKFMRKVYTDQRIPELNTQWKKLPFNTTRRNGELVFIMDKDFAYEYAQEFQFSSYLKPFMYKSQDRDTFNVEAERSRVIEIGALTPTTLAANKVLDPLNMTAATLPANTKLVGRIVDMNAIKFGVGVVDSVAMPLGARTMHYDEVRDYCFDMCPAYVNVPILINTQTFTAHRQIHVVQDNLPATPSTQSNK